MNLQPPLKLDILRYFALEDQQRLIERLDQAISPDDPLRVLFERALLAFVAALHDEQQRDEALLERLAQEHMGRSFYEGDDSRWDYDADVCF